jgi:hypothetical protein
MADRRSGLVAQLAQICSLVAPQYRWKPCGFPTKVVWRRHKAEIWEVRIE